MTLNLGSYLYPQKDCWNVDVVRWEGVDEVVDLNKLPWPWKDGAFDGVRALDIVEHLGKPTKVEIVQEIARVTKSGGIVTIRVPCATHYSALASLQHAHSFFINSFDENYTQPFFKLRERYLTLRDGGRLFFYGGPLARVWDFLLCHTSFIWTITFVLERK